MQTEIWKTINSHYEKARNCLWAPTNAYEWHRDEDSGMYHLWNAYYLAVMEAEKEQLLYARVLMMMNDELYNVHIYDRFHKYIKPAKVAYEAAMIEGSKKPSTKELEKVNHLYNSLEYVLKKTDNSLEQSVDAYSQIDGLNEVENFCFHDSKVIRFEHTENIAQLTLDYYGLAVTFEFIGLVELEINGDPTCCWINDFYCYRQFGNSNICKFDIGSYRITCEKIRVISVEQKYD